jgi:hypothetical protein
MASLSIRQERRIRPQSVISGVSFHNTRLVCVPLLTYPYNIRAYGISLQDSKLWKGGLHVILLCNTQSLTKPGCSSIRIPRILTKSPRFLTRMTRILTTRLETKVSDHHTTIKTIKYRNIPEVEKHSLFLRNNNLPILSRIWHLFPRK